MEATIKFKDGTDMTAEENGGSYILNQKPEFPEDLRDLEIESGSGKRTFGEAVLVECFSVDGRYWFSFMEKPEDRKREEELAELKETNDMLIECILEMSEVVYGEGE